MSGGPVKRDCGRCVTKAIFILPEYARLEYVGLPVRSESQPFI